ncbi:MAG: glycosyltransferase family 2 protein [Bryobacterales bacterium]|nr:glycosyltransferase family 2 protein [Bryobacterales bacterium]
MSYSIAVLMTCHNRRRMTLRCLQSLFAQTLPESLALRVYLVDDGSTDGTEGAVREAFPTVTIIPGTGMLFWCEGVRRAWKTAETSDPEFYLWLNDDVVLNPGSLAALLATTNNDWTRAVIAVGSCCDPVTKQHTYGGHVLTGSGHHPAQLAPVLPDINGVKACDTFNGNCVLVTRAAFRLVGVMRPFKHAMGDTDYGLLAKRKGVQNLIVAGYIAECASHPPLQSWRNRALPRRQRWATLVSRKGLPPGDWWRLLWTHAGLRAFLYWPSPYWRVLVGR